MIAVALLALAVQAGAADSIWVTGEPSPYEIFGRRQLIITHLAAATSGAGPRKVQRGDTLGVIEALPARLSPRHQATIEQARALFAQRHFADAAVLLAPSYRDEPDNPFVANEYARTLFWIDDRRDERASARYVYTCSSSAYVELGRTELARWSAQQALGINPRSGDALGYLYALGPGARSWGPTHIFACRLVNDSLPCGGQYVAFHKPGGGVACLWPREEPATALSPCLRIGWVYVGQPRERVEEILGTPWRATPPRDDGTEGFAYLVFHDSVRNRGSYHVVEYERIAARSVARAVQFTGDPTPLPRDFAGLRLGDRSDRVLRQLGPPESRGEFNDDAQGLRGEWWDWGTAGISVEIVSGRLYSIRLWRPHRVPPAVIERHFMRFR